MNTLCKIFYIPVLTLATLMTACEGTTTQVGNSLVQGQNEIIIDSAFVITGQSVENNRIQSRSITQVLGAITAENYGSFSSDFVTQFMPALNIDTTGVRKNDIDSLKLFMRCPIADITGDTLLPMGLKIYPLTQQLPAPIYSDFDPQGYYDPNNCIITAPYNACATELSDTMQVNANRYITVNMPVEMGRELFQIYKDNPANYATPSAFTKKFPGFYVTNSFGSGRIVRIAQTVMRLYYHKEFVNDQGNDTITRHVGYYYSVKPEVITNNIFKYEMSPELTRRIQQGENLIVAPAGRDVEIKFPGREIINAYLSQSKNDLSVINTLTFTFPAYDIPNDKKITRPTNLLMILSKDKNKFFIENKVTDDVTSFVATFNTTTGRYEFAGLRSYLIDLLEKYNDGSLTDDDMTFTLTPVTLEMTQDTSTGYYYYYQTSESVNAIVPYIGQPAMTGLDLNNSKIILTFSKQLNKN